MTDKEIIKALECCVSNSDSIIDEFCEQCPYQSANLQCMDEMVKDAHHLITCQKAEIERLEKLRAEASKECEALQKRIVFWREDLNYNPQEERAAAIREFAERLKEKKTSVCGGHGIYDFVVYECCIDNLVKEMTEDTDNA